jgi:hypothetical protein
MPDDKVIVALNDAIKALRAKEVPRNAEPKDPPKRPRRRTPAKKAEEDKPSEEDNPFLQLADEVEDVLRRYLVETVVSKPVTG